MKWKIIDKLRTSRPFWNFILSFSKISLQNRTIPGSNPNIMSKEKNSIQHKNKLEDRGEKENEIAILCCVYVFIIKVFGTFFCRKGDNEGKRK